MAERLLVNLDDHGQVTLGTCLEGGLPETAPQAGLMWPLDGVALEDLRWYLEDYLRAPFGVYGDRGPRVQAALPGWGTAMFSAVFGPGAGRESHVRLRDGSAGVEVVFRSASAALLGLPWELMCDQDGPLALSLAGLSRCLPTVELAETVEVPGTRLRVLMVISRPARGGDMGYRLIARPLLERLDAVRGDVDLTVLRPPTLDALRGRVTAAVAAGEPFHVVHFDGHGALSPGQEGVLVFERPRGGSHLVPASEVAAALAGGQVPVVVLNACQSGAVGKELEAAVATRLLQGGYRRGGGDGLPRARGSGGRVHGRVL
jgi:hypothetical protein